MKFLKPAALILMLALVGCSDPKKVVIPQDQSTWEKSVKPAIEKLPEDEKALAGRYLAQSIMRQALGGSGMPEGITLGEAIEQQRAAETLEANKAKEEAALKAKLEAEKVAKRKAFDQVFLITFMDKKLVKKDFLNESQILVGLQNKSPKEIIGFKGAMVFYNVFGEPIYTVNITDDNTFKPNETARMMLSLIHI